MLRVALGGSVPWLDSGGWRLGMYQALGSVCILSFFLINQSVTRGLGFCQALFSFL